MFGERLGGCGPEIAAEPVSVESDGMVRAVLTLPDGRSERLDIPPCGEGGGHESSA